jgi:hypothetical protein
MNLIGNKRGERVERKMGPRGIREEALRRTE